MSKVGYDLSHGRLHFLHNWLLDMDLDIFDQYKHGQVSSQHWYSTLVYKTAVIQCIRVSKNNLLRR